MKKYLFFLVPAALMMVSCAKQQPAGSPADKILLVNFNPVSVDNVQKTYVDRAKYTIIDMHSHDYAANREEIAQWVKAMDAVWEISALAGDARKFLGLQRNLQSQLEIILASKIEFEETIREHRLRLIRKIRCL